MQLLTANQIAAKLQVSKIRIYEMARTGLIPCVRMGRQIRFDEQAIQKWIARGGTSDKSDTFLSQTGGRN